MTTSHQKSSFVFSLLRKLLVKLKTVLVTLILMFLFPGIFLLVSIPFGLFRYTFHKLTTWWEPSVGKIVSLRGTVFAIDTLYTQPKASVVIGLIFQGPIDLTLLKKRVRLNLLKRTLPNGELQYPELKQYLNKRMGYYFWKNDPTFDLSRHVMTHKSKLSTYSDSDIKEIYEQLIHKPWEVNRPLWDMRIVSNFYPKGSGITKAHSVIFIRYHHALSDGYSMLRLLSEGLTEQEKVPVNATPSFSGRDWVKSLIFWVTFPLVGLWELAEFEVGNTEPVPFTPERKIQRGRFHVGVTDKILVNKVKEIKNNFGVGFGSVVYSACAGALRDIMIAKGMEVPYQIPCGTILPLPDHPQKLRNYM